MHASGASVNTYQSTFLGMWPPMCQYVLRNCRQDRYFARRTGVSSTHIHERSRGGTMRRPTTSQEDLSPGAPPNGSGSARNSTAVIHLALRDAILRGDLEPSAL